MMLRSVLAGEPSSAHQWRSLTLQTFDPGQHEAESRMDIYQESCRRKERFYHHARKRFDDYYRVFYRATETARREEQLLAIIRSAGELSSSLWKQKVYIEPRSTSYRGMPFRASSKEMTAHPAQRLEEDDNRMDGCPIQMVVQPAIFAFGNEEGKHYHLSKVWAKAVVWLGNPPAR